MHRQIAADAMPGAMREIEPGMPQELARQRIELRAGGAVGKRGAGNRDMAAQHPGKAVAHLLGRLADRDGAGDVGGAVLILRAGIDQQQVAEGDAAVGLAGDAVMHDGAVRPGAGDGRERDVLQRAGVAAERLQRFHGVDLEQPALRRLAVDPGEEARQRHGVAAMRGLRALDLDRVLDGLEQRHRIIAAHRPAAARGDLPAQRVRRGGIVERDRCAGRCEFRQGGGKRVGLPHLGAGFEMRAGAVGELAVVDEDGRPAVLRHQGVGQRQRRMRDVGAANVERPGHRVRIRHHQRIDLEPGDLGADPDQLVGLRLAGEFQRMHADGTQRRRRAFAPHRIERVVVYGDQFGAGFGAGRGQPFGCRRSVQPRIKTEAVAGLQMLAEPLFRGRFDQRLDTPGPQVDLFGGLQRVAAVDEHCGLVRQHDRQTGRAGEAGEPGQALLRRRYIFVLLLVRAGNHESGEPGAQQFLAKRRQPRGQRDAAFGLFKSLENGFEHDALP